jgi:Na+-driven multidrug efflux pump
MLLHIHLPGLGGSVQVLAQYVFVYLLGLGFMGSPLGLALTWACSPFLLLAYILLAGAHRKTWHGWSWCVDIPPLPFLFAAFTFTFTFLVCGRLG